MKIVLIGLGMVAGTHLAALRDSPSCTLHGVLSRSPQTASAFLLKHCSDTAETPRIYGSIAEVCADPEVDFVILCTPPDARQEIVNALAAANKPILMEKPVERDTEAARHIVETCEHAGVQLGIVFQHRMRAASQKLAQVMQAGALGRIGVVEISVPWWREQTYYDEPGRGTYARDGGGVLISQAIHTLDLALSLAGPVTRVQAVARTTTLHQMEAEDIVAAGLDFANGAVGTLVASTASFPGGAESIRLHGENGSATLASGILRIDWRNGETETFGEVAGTGGGADPMAFTHDWHREILEDFIEAVRTKRLPVVPGRAALDVHELIDALVASSRTGRAVNL